MTDCVPLTKGWEAGQLAYGTYGKCKAVVWVGQTEWGQTECQGRAAGGLRVGGLVGRRASR